MKPEGLNAGGTDLQLAGETAIRRSAIDGYEPSVHQGAQSALIEATPAAGWATDASVEQLAAKRATASAGGRI